MLERRAMENYEREPLIEQYSDPFPFDGLENDPSCFQIKVEGKNTRLRTVVNRSLKNFGSGKKIVFIAQGREISKAVNCVEIMKTYYKKPIYQITRINQLKTIETWYPLVEGLDPIRVTRSVPAIYILISQEKLDENEDGYQVYNHRDPKKVLNLQVVEASDSTEMSKLDVTENMNNLDLTCDQDESQIQLAETQIADDINCKLSLTNNEI